MPSLIALASRRSITIPVTLATILPIAVFQHLYVLNMDPEPARMVVPTVVAITMGWVLSSVAKVNLRIQAQRMEIGARKAEIEALNGRLEKALALQVEERMGIEEQLLQAQRMESVGQMAAGIAHDLNNVLTVVLGGAELLKINATEDVARRADLLGNAAGTGAGLLRQLMAFVRGNVETSGSLDVGEVVQDLRPLLAQLAGEGIAVNVHIGPGDLRVSGLAAGMDQVLLNLVSNSRDAMDRPVGVIDIDIRQDGDRVVMTVKDDGVGMDEDTREKAAEPLFTTKKEGLGTGLGLSVVTKQVEALAGSMSIHSEVGMGTAVAVSIPCVDPDELTGEGPLGASGPQGSEHILVVEDDLVVQLTLAGILEHAGYEVSRAADVGGARVELERGAPDLVVSSVGLPGRCDWPTPTDAFLGAKVLLVGGMPGVGWPTEGVPAVCKPYTAGQILRAVRRRLDAEDAHS